MNNVAKSSDAASSPASGRSISVGVVAPSRRSRAYWRILFESSPGFRFSWARKSLEAFPSPVPDVLFIDVVPAAFLARESAVFSKLPVSNVKLVMVADPGDEEAILPVLRAGICGFLLKPVAPLDVLAAVEIVHGGGCVMCPGVTRRVLEYLRRLPEVPGGGGRLTRREVEILNLYRRGLTLARIARQLGCAYHTVRTHVRNIREKLEVHSTREAVAKYFGL